MWKGSSLLHLYLPMSYDGVGGGTFDFESHEKSKIR